MVMFYFSANYHVDYIIKLLANVFIFVSCIILLMKRASPLYLHFNCDNRYLSWWFRSIWEICMNIVCNGEGVDFILISMFSVSFLWTRPRIEQNHRQTAGTSRDRQNMVFFAQNQINILYDFFEQSISFLKDGKCFKDSKWSGLGISRPLRRSHSVSIESRKSIVLNTKKIQNFRDTCCYFISKCSSDVSIHSITINSVYFDD